jgi:hypothetical protein
MVARRKPRPVPQWEITFIKSTPARYLGRVDAPDEAAALKEAAKEFKISDVLQNRLVARRILQ